MMVRLRLGNLLFFPLVFIFSLLSVNAQVLTNKKQIPGTPCKECKQNQNNQRQNQPVIPQDGNASDNTSYTVTACGLNWTAGSVVIEQRTIGVVANPPAGLAQPAAINIAGIPPCATIVKAFLYCDASGNGVPITASVTNPGGGNGNYPMTQIGTDVDKCWGGVGYGATYSYRADVTPIITTNGAYQVSGLPVAPSPGPNDVDGATLIIVFQDPTQTYTGSFVIGDGCHVYSGFQTITDNLTGFSACAASNNATAFMVLADLQGINNTTCNLNNTPFTELSTNDAWWNFLQTPTTVTAGQNTSLFNSTNSGDCYNVVLCGLYYQTACNTCTAAGSLTVTASASLPCSPTTSATANAVGGSGNYSYSWSSGQNTQTITGVAAGNYTVTVTDNSLACTLGTATVTIPGITAPVLTVNSATLCAGGTATLTVNGAVTYNWSPPTNLSSTTAATVTANPPSTTVYTITGVVATCTSVTTATVTVNPIPVVNVNSPSYCIGFNAPLTATGATTYSWTPAGGLSNTNLATVTASPTVTTNYTVTGTSLGCSGSATSIVTVLANPTLTVNSGTICIGQQTANLVVTGANTYTWSPGTGLNSINSPNVISNPTVSVLYTITGMAVNGCVNTATASVTANPLPNVTVTSGTICVGQQTATLTANGALTYTWAPVVGLNTGTGASVVANPGATSSYIVTGTDNNGCVSAAISTVTVNSLPVVSVSTGTVCSGKATTLVANGAVNYSWAPPTGLNTSFSPTVTANPPSLTVYTITGTDIHGCTSTATTQVSVNPNPTVTINPLNASGCVPQCVNFTNAGPSTGVGTWNFGDGTTALATGMNHCYLVQGTYTVKFFLRDVNGCVDSSYATVTAYPVPKADFYATPQPTSILEPNLQFVDQTTHATIISWGWNFGDTSGVSSIQSPKHTYRDTGNYFIWLTVVSDHGCRDSIMKMIRIEPDYEMFVPNAFSPNGDGINEIFLPKGDGITEFKLYVFDRWGKLVFSSYDLNTGWDGRYQYKGGDIVQEDVYIWKIDLKDYKHQRHTLSGHVNLIK